MTDDRPTTPRRKGHNRRRGLAAFAETSPRIQRLQAVAEASDAELADRGFTRLQAIRCAIGPGGAI